MFSRLTPLPLSGEYSMYFFHPLVQPHLSIFGSVIQKYSKWAMSGIKIHYPSVILRCTVSYRLDKIRKIIKYLHDHRNADNSKFD